MNITHTVSVHGKVTNLCVQTDWVFVLYF